MGKLTCGIQSIEPNQSGRKKQPVVVTSSLSFSYRVKAGNPGHCCHHLLSEQLPAVRTATKKPCLPTLAIPMQVGTWSRRAKPSRASGIQEKINATHAQPLIPTSMQELNCNGSCPKKTILREMRALTANRFAFIVHSGTGAIDEPRPHTANIAGPFFSWLILETWYWKL